MRTTGLIVCAMAAICAFQPGICRAEIPARPLTMIVPYPPAGPVDVIARIIAERMGRALGQPVVVENVPGAGGSVGVARAARAAPDGYTLSIGDWTSHVASQVIYPVHYDVRQDFRPISLLSTSPQLIVGRRGLPFNDLSAVIAALKASPESMTAATVGPGSNPHMCGISLEERTGIRLRFVPYRGGAPAIQDLLASRVDLMCSEGTMYCSTSAPDSLRPMRCFRRYVGMPLPIFQQPTRPVSPAFTSNNGGACGRPRLHRQAWSRRSMPRRSQRYAILACATKRRRLVSRLCLRSSKRLLRSTLFKKRKSLNGGRSLRELISTFSKTCTGCYVRICRWATVRGAAEYVRCSPYRRGALRRLTFAFRAYRTSDNFPEKRLGRS